MGLLRIFEGYEFVFFLLDDVQTSSVEAVGLTLLSILAKVF